MKERFEGHHEYGPEHPPGIEGARIFNSSRLEEVGDLHFYASGYSSALDYYQQIYTHSDFSGLDSSIALNVLRKASDCLVLLGHLERAEILLNRADDILDSCRPAKDDFSVPTINAQFQIRRAWLLLELSQLNECLRVAKMAFAVLALTDEHKEVAHLQAIMGVAHHRLGRMEKAEEFYSDSLATYRRIGWDLGIANLLNNLAVIKKNNCEWESALSLMDKATSLAKQIGSSSLLPGFYLNQGVTLTKSNRLGEAKPLFDKGRNVARSLGDQVNLCRLLLASGNLETQDGRLAHAEELLMEGKNLAEQNRYLREATIADEYLGDVLLARGLPEKALFNYQLGLEKSRTIASGNDLEGELLRRSAEAHLAAGRFSDAIALSQAAVAVCEQCGEVYELAFCHLVLAKAYSGSHDRQMLKHHFQDAISIFKEQGLVKQWCQTILEFSAERRGDAPEAELLLMRRYLMDAQDQGASSVSDSMLCKVLKALALVQIQLKQFDDALLSVFELERQAIGLDDEGLNHTIVQIREQIELGLVGGSESSETHLEAISNIPGLFSNNDSSVFRNLVSVLTAGMERVGADNGFIAMTEESIPGAPLKIVSLSGLTENLAGQLSAWFSNHLAENENSGMSFFSRLDGDNELIENIPAMQSVIASCVFMPIALKDRNFGMLFLGKEPKSALGASFGRNSLDFLTTYMGFLALFRVEKSKSKDTLEVETPIQRIESFENIITQSDKMLEVLGLAQKVAPSNLTVLLNGETGTGKGLLAYSIHALSQRCDQRFLQINCAAIPDALLESELFGHVKGAFTGADSNKKGLLESAEGGTVFLDEIGKMPLNMQGKLLQFLDSKTIRPVGGDRELQIDVRLIAASKTDLHVAAHNGNFLEDLYYRLLDFPLVIPPLRERLGDVPLLTRHFVQRFAQEISAELPVIDHSFMEALTRSSWPGNVRELEKTVKRAIVLAQNDGALCPEHLPGSFEISAEAVASLSEAVNPLKDTLAKIECREISRALLISEGNKSQAARTLKISYPNLLKKIRHYGIDQN